MATNDSTRARREMSAPREPKDETLLAARLAWHEDATKWATGPYGIARLADELCDIERAWRRHCERCCSGEDGGYVRFEDGRARHDPEAEERADKRLRNRVRAWVAKVPGGTVELQGDPRGAVLLLKLPGETEARAV